MENDNRKEIVHIAMATDANYLWQTMVAVRSVITRGNIKSHICFHILMNEVADEKKEEFNALFDNRSDNVNIEFLDVSGMISDALQINHISPTTCSRLLLPQLLSKIDRCLYLDSDVIVNDDIEALYWTDLSDNLIFGVKALSYHIMSNGQKEHHQGLIGIPKMDQYINAGVLLMNLSEMRKSGFCTNALALISEHFPTQDQDILNRECYNRIGFLPPKYNLATTWIVDHKLEYCDNVFSHEEVSDILNHPCIIHYCDAIKPWDFPESLMADKWWRICEKTSKFSFFYNMAKKAFYYAVLNRSDCLWSYARSSNEWLEEAKKRKSIYIYGFGKNAKMWADSFAERGIIIKGFLVSDNGLDKINEYNGIPIRKFPTSIEEDAIIIVATRKVFFKEIRDLLYDNDIGSILYAPTYSEEMVDKK